MCFRARIRYESLNLSRLSSGLVNTDAKLERVRHREMHGTRQEVVAWLMWDYSDNAPTNNGFTHKCHSKGKVCRRLFKLQASRSDLL
jgi:hypothetical protein